MDGRVVELCRNKTEALAEACSYDAANEGDDFKVVKLVEHDPRTDAVVKAAVKWLHADVAEQDVALTRAIERYLKPRLSRAKPHPLQKAGIKLCVCNDEQCPGGTPDCRRGKR